MSASRDTRGRAKRIATLALGGLLVLVGITGLVLPFLQGFLLVLAGLYLLSRESEAARSLLGRIRRRFPELDRRGRELASRAKAFLGRKR